MRFPRKFFIFYFIILFFSLAGFVFAQRGLEVNYPEFGGIRPTVTTISLPEYVKYIFNISIALAGLIAFGALFYAGFRYLTSAGNIAAMQDAKERIGAAILGLLVLLSSYFILTTINPQLTFFNLPEIERFFSPPLNFEPPTPGTLRATEIPLGGLIREAIDSEILNDIVSVSVEIENAAEEIQALSRELKSLTDSCSCTNTSPNAGSCSYGASCPATQCLNDPCPARSLIESTRAELLAKTNELEPLLENREEEDGSSGLKELAENLRENLQNLEAAEGLMKTCESQGRILLGPNDFEEFSRNLKEIKEIERIEIERPWQGLDIEADPVFYCAEQPDSSLITAPTASEGEIPAQVPEGDFKEVKSFCNKEIPIGQAVDQTENLISGIISEIQLIIENSEAESVAGENLAALQCSGSEVCSTGCNEYSYECGRDETVLCSETDSGATCATDPNTGEQICICSIYIPRTCYACDVLACSGPSPCPNSEIAVQASLIETAYPQINSSYRLVSDLIDEEEGGKTRAEEIAEFLEDSRIAIGNCYNLPSSWAKIQRGEKVILEELISCGFIEMLAENQIYYYDEESGDEIRACYTPEPGREDRLNNYLCCESEVGL